MLMFIIAKIFLHVDNPISVWKMLMYFSCGLASFKYKTRIVLVFLTFVFITKALLFCVFMCSNYTLLMLCLKISTDSLDGYF